MSNEATPETHLLPPFRDREPIFYSMAFVCITDPGLSGTCIHTSHDLFVAIGHGSGVGRARLARAADRLSHRSG